MERSESVSPIREGGVDSSTQPSKERPSCQRRRSSTSKCLPCIAFQRVRRVGASALSIIHNVCTDSVIRTASIKNVLYINACLITSYGVYSVAFRAVALACKFINVIFTGALSYAFPAIHLSLVTALVVGTAYDFVKLIIKQYQSYSSEKGLWTFLTEKIENFFQHVRMNTVQSTLLVLKIALQIFFIYSTVQKFKLLEYAMQDPNCIVLYAKRAGSMLLNQAKYLGTVVMLAELLYQNIYKRSPVYQNSQIGQLHWSPF